MRRTELPCRDYGVALSRKPGDGVDLRTLKHLLLRHVRKDARQALAHHAFARSGRSDEQYVVTARCGDLHRTLYVVLTLYVGKIGVSVFDMLKLARNGGSDAALSPQVRHKLRHVSDRVDGNAVGVSRLVCVVGGNEQLLYAAPHRLKRHGQRTAHGAQFTAERQLAKKRLVRSGLRNAALRRQQSQEYRQVVDGARLLGVRRGKVHGYAGGGQVKAVRLRRRSDSLPCLLDGGIGQSHDVERRQAVCDIALHRDLVAAYSLYAE